VTDDRDIDGELVEREMGVQAVKLNAFDKFLLAKKNGKIGPGVTFYEQLTEDPKVIPVFKHGTTKAVWPLTENFGYSMMLLHKRNVVVHSDIKGSHDSYLEAFNAFLRGPSVPPGVTQAILRAHKSSVHSEHENRGVGNRRRNSHKPLRVDRRDGVRGGCEGDGPEVDTPLDDELGPLEDTLDDHGAIEIGDFEMEQTVRRPAPVGWISTFPLTEYPVNFRTFLKDLSSRYYKDTASQVFTLPTDESGIMFCDPLSEKTLKNEGQRVALCVILEFLKFMDEWETAPTITAFPERLRIMIAGVAGTGKSFILKMFRAFAMIYTGSSTSFLAVAPSGASGGGIGASTVDRAMSFSRTKSVYRDLPNKTLLSLQLLYRDLLILCGDEISMWGQKMVGHFASRCDDVLNGGKCADGEDDVTTFGDVPCLAVIGDFKQLKPVLDNSLCVRASTNKLCMLGKLAYQSMNRVLLLDTPMRQNHTSSLFTHLTNLRDAKLSQVDVDFWHTRQLNKITNNRRVDLDKWSLANSDVLYATCFNKDRDNLNSDYIQTMDHVFVVKATCAGVHAIAANHIKAGPLKSIPRLSYLAVGMMVKVTTNYVPELGIFNNARGTVVDIIYENGYNPEICDVHPVVVVNLPDYTGPPMSADFGLNGRGKWIAFTADTKICDCFSCSRVGIRSALKRQ
jgi:hypothetical protein